MMSPAPFLLSATGSGRASAYLESGKIITFRGRTHVTWLDTPPEGFRIKIRTLDHASGQWSSAVTVGEAVDNHGGPALTVDAAGYLHIVYFSHHHPFRYHRSVRPNDAGEWGEMEQFGRDLTYPTLLCAPDGTLVAQSDSQPVGGTRPMRGWSPGETVRDQFAILVPPEAVAGEGYTLRIGLYDLATSARALLEGSSDDGVTIGSVQVIAAP